MTPTPCPSCQRIMNKHHFERLHHGEVILDLCYPCQGIWFDDFESVQITPGGIIELFKLLNEHRDTPCQPLRDPLRCPRCREKLLHGIDRAKYGGQFNYHRCLQKHGRFTTFGQFMIEKGFVRQLAPAEITALAVRVGTIRCNGCGAPVDIRHHHACTHCRAPIAILDADAVEQALARYQHAEIKRTTVNVETLGDAIVMRERENSRRNREQSRRRIEEIEVGDLLLSGVELLWKLVFRRES
ncbi:MAG: hypothetical protein ACK4FP_04790 [Azonexus sp.]